MLDIPEGEYGRTREGKRVGPLHRVATTYVTPGFYYMCDQMRGGYYAEGVSQRDGKERPTDLMGIWPTSPVVTETVTKTRIVPGTYDRVFVGEGPHSRKVAVAITGPRLDDEIRAWSLNADELDAAAAVLSALAKGLRDA